MSKIPILMYHSIESMPRSTVMRSIHVPPRRFKLQMFLLKILGYKALSIRDLKPYLDGHKVGKVVGLTFDDGYQNNLINAAPVLKKYDFTATCYLVTENIGKSNEWDLHKNITQRPLMNQEEISEWINLGMDIGAHTKNHVDLTSVSYEDAKMEIEGCKYQLESLFNQPVADFCYPFGRYNEKISMLVKDSGFHTATSMDRGRVNHGTNMFQLPRIPINHHTLPHLFLTKLMTRYEDRR